MFKGLDKFQQKEIKEYCDKALELLCLNKEDYKFKLNNYEDIDFRKDFDLKRPVPYGGSNPGYYAYFHDIKAIVIDADDYLANINNDSVWKKKVLHEVRHAYQYKQIELLENNKNFCEQIDIILSWKADFETKKINGASIHNITEKDADSYSSKNWDNI